MESETFNFTVINPDTQRETVIHVYSNPEELKMGSWTNTCEGEQGTLAFHAALDCCKGCYQTDLIRGWENLSGSTLRGKAAHWGMKYAISRVNLLNRVRKANIPFHEERQKRGRRVLILGTW